MSKNNEAVWKYLVEQGLATNLQGVEIETSAEDDGEWYQSSYYGGKNKFIRDEQFHPTIDVTIFDNDGNQQHRRLRADEYYYSRDEARQIANEEAQQMWKTARGKGVPVIMKTGTHKQIQSSTKNAAYLQWEYDMNQGAMEDEYLESPKGRVLFIVFAIVLIAACFFVWVVLPALMGKIL